MKNNKTRRFDRETAFRNFALATSASAIALGLAAPTSALAQAGEAAQAGGLDEVVVTARKRAENLQDTPISISATTGAQLDDRGVTLITGISNYTPNLVLQNVPSNSGITSNAAVYIRGIGQSDFAPTVEPGVGIYVDGVYLGRSVGGVFDLLDIEQVEVLRGPQGTLFGRNTIGGAVSITTAKPTDEYQVKGDVQYGTDDMVNARGVVNIPMGDKVAARLSGGYSRQDGYVDHPFGGDKLGNKKSYTARGAIRFDLASNLELNINADYFNDKSNGPAVSITGIDETSVGSFVALNNALVASGAPPAGFGGPGDPTLCLTPAYASNPACYNSQYFSNTVNYGSGPNYSKIKTWSTSGTFVWDLDNVEVKSISAYRRIKGAFAQDRDGSPVHINHVADSFRQWQFSQELQFQGKALDDRLNWLFGLYYFKEKGENINPVDFLPVQIQSGGYFNYRSFAAFSQMTYDFTDRLSLTAGVRYTDDNKKYLPDQFFEGLPLGPLFTCFDPVVHTCGIGDRVVPLETVTAKDNAWTPMATLSYKPADGLMVYGTYSRGYKSGGFTQRIFPPEQSLPSFDPETVDSFEGGVKWTSPNDQLRVNLAGYYTKYKDMQLLVADATRVGPFFTNAGRSRITGFEAEIAYAPGGGWRINATSGLTDAKFTSLDNTVQGLTTANEFVLVPKWTASAGIEKEFMLGGDARVTPRVDASYKSGIYTNASGISSPRLYQDATVLLNAIVRLDLNDNVAVTVGGQNLTDEKFRNFGDFQAPFGFYVEGFDRGRQWFVKVGFDY